MKKPDFSNLVSGLLSALPEGAKNLPKDLEQNFHDLIQAEIHRMDLVTREEFDAQVKVLHRCRKRLKELEDKLT